MALSVTKDTLFIAGNFTDINGSARKIFASVLCSDGTLTSFEPAWILFISRNLQIYTSIKKTVNQYGSVQTQTD